MILKNVHTSVTKYNVHKESLTLTFVRIKRLFETFYKVYKNMTRINNVSSVMTYSLVTVFGQFFLKNRFKS